MILAIVGVVLILVAVGLLFWRRSQEDKLREIKGVETSTAQELVDLVKHVTEQLGESGSFGQIAEVKGVIRCDSPLTSELAKQPCAYYTMSVSREYEETYTDTDSEGRQVQKTRRSSENVASNSQGTPFWVEDATGRIMVNPDGAWIDPVQVVNRFEPGEPQGTSISFGGFNLNIGGITFGSGTRTLGYRYTESVLPLERRSYVLGEASDASGQLTIQKPRDKGRRFMISLKSEEELVRSTGAVIKWLLAGAIACGAIGLILIIAGLITGV